MSKRRNKLYVPVLVKNRVGKVKIILISTKNIKGFEDILPSDDQIRNHLINLLSQKREFRSIQIALHFDMWNTFVKEISKKVTGAKYDPQLSIDLVSDLKSKPIIQILRRK